MTESKPIDYFGEAESAEQWADVKQGRLDWIAREGKDFEGRIKEEFAPEDAARIEEALDWMIALHASQKDHRSGEPFLAHPLAVTATVERDFGVRDPDVIIAALLHDAVEDQPLHLALDSIYKKYPDARGLSEKEIKKRFGDEIRAFALHRIEEKFKGRVAYIVDRLSNPDFDELITMLREKMGVERTKHQLYKEHVQEIVHNPDVGVFIIKIADLLVNTQYIEHLSESDPQKDRLHRRYGPVIKEVILPTLALLDESHPLYSRRKELSERFEDLYKREFEGKY